MNGTNPEPGVPSKDLAFTDPVRYAHDLLATPLPSRIDDSGAVFQRFLDLERALQVLVDIAVGLDVTPEAARDLAGAAAMRRLAEMRAEQRRTTSEATGTEADR